MATKPKNAKPAPDAALEVVTLEAVEPLRVDGDDLAPGDLFEVSPRDAAALLASGAARATPPTGG